MCSMEDDDNQEMDLWPFGQPFSMIYLRNVLGKVMTSKLNLISLMANRGILNSFNN